MRYAGGYLGGLGLPIDVLWRNAVSEASQWRDDGIVPDYFNLLLGIVEVNLPARLYLDDQVASSLMMRTKPERSRSFIPIAGE